MPRFESPTFNIPTESEPDRDALELAMHAATLDVLGVKLPDQQKRTPQEVQQLKEKISLIYKVFSKNYNADVVPSPNGGWACALDPKAIDYLNKYMKGEIASLDDLPDELFHPNQFLYDLNDLASLSEDAAIGVTRHEVGHSNNTDYRLFIKGQKVAKDEGYLPTSWAWIANALEDPWINNIEIGGSETVRQKMNSLYAAKFPEILEKINTQPSPQQLGLNLQYYWATGENIPTLKDPKILEMFEQLKPHFDEFFRGPDAKTNYDNLFHNIWPVYKALEEKALTEEQMKEMMRKMAKDNLGKPQEGQSGEGQPQSGGGQGQSGGMMQKFKKMFGGGGTDGDKQDSEPSEADKELQKEIDQKSGSDLKKEIAKELEKQRKALEQKDKELKEQGKKTGEVPDDIDLSEVSPEILKELEEIAKQLTPEQKKELEKLARENLDKKQVEAIKKNGPKHMEAQKDQKTGQYELKPRKAPKDKDVEKVKENIEQFNQEQEQQSAEQQAQEAAQQAQQQARQSEQLREQLEKQDMLKNGFDEQEKDLYKKFKDLENSMLQRIANFLTIMDRYLPKKETYEYGGENYTGIKVNQRSIPRRAPIKDYRIYERRQVIESTEPRMFVELLIDNSGSMSGQKMQESLKTAIFWGRVLRMLEIPFSIKFFGDQVKDIMTFDDDYDDPKKKIKPNLVRSANASGGSTDMGSPLKQAHEEVVAARRKYVGSFGAVFVISDSGANSGLTGDALKRYIEDIQKNFLVTNFILTKSPQEIESAKHYFGEKNVIAPENFEDLPEESFKILRVTLERIMKVYKPQS